MQGAFSFLILFFITQSLNSPGIVGALSFYAHRTEKPWFAEKACNTQNKSFRGGNTNGEKGGKYGRKESGSQRWPVENGKRWSRRTVSLRPWTLSEMRKWADLVWRYYRRRRNRMLQLPWLQFPLWKTCLVPVTKSVNLMYPMIIVLRSEQESATSPGDTKW